MATFGLNIGNTNTNTNRLLGQVANSTPAVGRSTYNLTDILNRYLDKNAPQSTITNFTGVAQVPGQQSTVDLSKVAPVISMPGIGSSSSTTVGMTQPTAVFEGPAAPSFDLTQRDKLQAEVDALEKRIAGAADDYQDEARRAGIFRDQRRLNELKAELQRVSDREIEIPLEERMRLRGTGATLREFQNSIDAPLEANALDVLANTRAVAAQTDIINTNLAVLNTYFTQRNEADQFAYEQKTSQLNAIQEAYGSFLTENQKVAIEEKKAATEAAKAETTFQNDLFKTVLEAKIEQGADLSAISRVLSSGGGLSALSSIGGSTASTDDAIGGAQPTIDLIDSLLSNEKGLKTSVGTNILGRNTITGGSTVDFLTGGLLAQDDANKFRTDLASLANNETLSKFLSLKDAGATFGAMSDSEWDIVQKAATRLGAAAASGKSNLSEKDFKGELNRLKLAQMKVAIRASMTPEQYAASGLRDVQDINKVSSIYSTIKARQPEASGVVDYASYDLTDQLAPTFNTLQNEEGFRTEAYRDGTGFSIGFGTQNVGGKPVQQGQTVTPEEAANETVSQVLNNYTSFADKITRKLTPNQFAALTSFEYNLGPGIWKQAADILASVNAGNFDVAGKLMQAYNKASGKVNETLVARRQREANLLLS